jgi:hypothetical protein
VICDVEDFGSFLPEIGIWLGKGGVRFGGLAELQILRKGFGFAISKESKDLTYIQCF